MSDIRDQMIKKGLAKEPTEGKEKKKYKSPEEIYKDHLTQCFGPDYISLILTGGGKNYNQYIDSIKKFVNEMKRDFTTSQLRNIFSKLKNIDEPSEVWRLRPNLAYISGRIDKKGIKELTFLLDELIQNIQKIDIVKLKNFKGFFEAIIAYRKFYGEK